MEEIETTVIEEEPPVAIEDLLIIIGELVVELRMMKRKEAKRLKAERIKNG